MRAEAKMYDKSVGQLNVRQGNTMDGRAGILPLNSSMKLERS